MKAFKTFVVGVNILCYLHPDPNYMTINATKLGRLYLELLRLLQTSSNVIS